MTTTDRKPAPSDPPRLARREPPYRGHSAEPETVTHSRDPLERTFRSVHARVRRAAKLLASPPSSPPPLRSDAHPPGEYWTMRANSSGSRLAPPTRTPSMSGSAISSSMFDALTDPPYWMRTAPAVAASVSWAVLVADRRADGLRVGGRRGAAGADRPDRFVGDDERGDLLLRPALERRGDLAEHLGLGVTGLALLQASRPRRRSASCRGAGSRSPCRPPSRRSRRTAHAARCDRRSRSAPRAWRGTPVTPRR